MAFAQWRPLILASAVTAALGGAVVIQTVTQDDGGGPVAADPTPTATIAGEPSPTPTPPPLPQEPIEELANPLTRRLFEAGELVDVTNAVGFLSAESGVIETWAAPGTAYIAASRDGSLLMTTDTSEPTSTYVLVERESGTAYRLAPGITPLVDSAHGGLLIVGIASDGRFDTAILDLRVRAFRPLGVGAEAGSAFAAFAAADGRRAVMQAGDTIAVVDMVANTAFAIGTTFAANTYQIELLPGGLGFRIVSYEEGAQARWFGWDGEEVTDMPPPGEPTQNGRYFAEETSFGRVRAFGVGGYPVVSYVTVHDRSTEDDVIRLLGTGLVARRASWSASGDSLVLEVPEGYVVVNLDGDIVAEIEDPDHWLGPAPSPAINNLYGTQRGTIINTTRGVRVEPDYREDVTLSARWSDRPGELIVAITQAGKGRDWPVQVLPFETRKPPFDGAPGMVVAGGECLAVMDGVGVDAAEVDCVAPGSVGALLEVDDPLYDPNRDKEGPFPVIGVRTDAGTVLLSVEFEDGATGWVDAARLRWAE